MKYVRKIKCPIHYVLKPGFPPFEMIPNPLLANVSEEAIRLYNLRRWIPKKDKHGRLIRNRDSWYQPEVTAAWAIEHCYDPQNPECIMKCKRRCHGEGIGKVLETSIGRLNGGRYKG